MAAIFQENKGTGTLPPPTPAHLGGPHVPLSITPIYGLVQRAGAGDEHTPEIS